ncbi:hypothetical protein AX16_009194 [Volvariella volvacea WC 439]|nr:hypothetical protein AX16_009194 [Volvariella volvacea WC 439]
MASRNGTARASAQSPTSNGTAEHLDATVATSIPPVHENRTLVLCFDGTGDQFDADNSNIVEFFSALKKDDRTEQMVYYQAGIGTWTSPQIATPMAASISKSLDEAIAWNLDAHVMDGYEFLMQNYIAGDRICLFGFSRGAYTASSLAGMIHKVGLLPACNHQQVPFAYKMYTRTDETGWEQSNLFKKTFSVDVDIEFVGLWDTVNSVGLIPRRLPFTTSNTIVKTFRHALALDERRAKFKPKHWRHRKPKEAMMSITDQHIEQLKKDKEKKRNQKDKDHHPHRQNTLKAMEMRYRRDPTEPTDVKEVWFAGCHCDVGGGSVPNRTKNNLARIPLRWMIRECFRTATGIMFDPDSLRKLGLSPDSLYPVVLERPAALPVRPHQYLVTIDEAKKALAEEEALAKAEHERPNYSSGDSSSALAPVNPFQTEEECDLLDALSPIYDQLSLNRFWWILEIIPMRVKEQNEVALGWRDRYFWWVPRPRLPRWLGGRGRGAEEYHEHEDASKPRFEVNWGRARKIPKKKKDGVYIHRTVDTRMKASYRDERKYVPRAEFKGKHVIWVD